MTSGQRQWCRSFGQSVQNTSRQECQIHFATTACSGQSLQTTQRLMTRVCRRCHSQNSTLKEIRRNLQLHMRPDFVLWVGIRFAIAYLCRISEWAVNDKNTVRWEHLVFYTHKRSAGGRQKINLTSADQLEDIAEGHSRAAGDFSQ